MRVLVIGANGNTATRVIRRLKDSDHDPVAMIRNPSHRAKFDKSNKSPRGYKVHLHAIGAARDGSVVAVNNHGVFRSRG